MKLSVTEWLKNKTQKIMNLAVIAVSVLGLVAAPVLSSSQVFALDNTFYVRNTGGDADAGGNDDYCNGATNDPYDVVTGSTVPGQDCAFQTIQAAVSAASSGDTVVVESGTYNESVDVTVPLTLQGANAGISAFDSRASETTIVSTGTALNLKAENVTVDGFTIDAVSGISTEQDTSATGVTIQNNIITGSVRAISLHSVGDSTDTSILNNDLLSDSRTLHVSADGSFSNLVVTGNHFSGGDENTTGIQFFNDTPIDGFTFTGNEVYQLANMGALISDGLVDSNIFLPVPGVLGLQIQLHDSTISNNSFGGDLSAACLQIFGSQFGLTPSGNVTIESNDFSDCGDSSSSTWTYAIQLSQDIHDVTIMNNNIDNAYDAFNTRIGDGWDFTDMNITIEENNVTNTRRYGASNTVTGTMVVTNNYWGSASESDITDLMNGDVDFDPWYISSDRDLMSDEVSGSTITSSDDRSFPVATPGTVNLPGGFTDLPFTGNGKGLDVSGSLETPGVPPTYTIGGQPLTVDKNTVLVSGDSGTPITISNQAVPGVTLSIPDGSKLSSTGSSWDGILLPPQSASTAGSAPSGFSFGDTVIEVGSPDTTLVFDNYVTLTLTGVSDPMAYKLAGTSDWLAMEECGGTYASPLSPTFPGECYISDGTDTKILTFHLTQFTTLVANPAASSSSSSSSSSPVSAASQTTPTSGYSAVESDSEAPVLGTSAGTSATSTEVSDIATEALIQEAAKKTQRNWYWVLALLALLGIALYEVLKRINLEDKKEN